MFAVLSIFRVHELVNSLLYRLYYRSECDIIIINLFIYRKLHDPCIVDELNIPLLAPGKYIAAKYNDHEKRHLQDLSYAIRRIYVLSTLI